ncbi:MAG: aromatic ring-hydroxylating dioxygenase subunit alpha [Gammaproteobacteria bacterium]|nr:aromatic ring-hydroxylating dioxygenase subunit alpha [Gammaproteobacteria bacterium]
MSILDKVPLSAIKRAQANINEAAGLPNAAYADPELFIFERDHVFAPTWAGLEYVSEIPEKGYAKPVDFMGLPLLIVRDKQGQIKVFHNVCSHRGMILVDDEGPIRNLIRCRYHSWSYNLDGELKSTPHIGGVGQNTAEGFSCEGNGLKPVRSAVWMGILFINLDGKAEPFAEYIQPLEERWEQFTGTGALQQVEVAETDSDMQLRIKANWKLAVENYCEAYHLPWVHPGLNSYSPLDQHVNLMVNENMAGQGTLNYTLSEISGHTLPKFAAWPQQRIKEGEYISLFPNLLLGVQVDHVFAIILQPQACDDTIEKLQISYVNKEAIGDTLADCRHAVMASWKIVFEEDIFAVESMQQGRHSPGFDGGVFSPVLDAPSHVFHSWVSRRYEAVLSSINSNVNSNSEAS